MRDVFFFTQRIRYHGVLPVSFLLFFIDPVGVGDTGEYRRTESMEPAFCDARQYGALPEYPRS